MLYSNYLSAVVFWINEPVYEGSHLKRGQFSNQWSWWFQTGRDFDIFYKLDLNSSWADNCETFARSFVNVLTITVRGLTLLQLIFSRAGY